MDIVEWIKKWAIYIFFKFLTRLLSKQDYVSYRRFEIWSVFSFQRDVFKGQKHISLGKRKASADMHENFILYKWLKLCILKRASLCIRLAMSLIRKEAQHSSERPQPNGWIRKLPVPSLRKPKLMPLGNHTVHPHTEKRGIQNKIIHALLHGELLV